MEQYKSVRRKKAAWSIRWYKPNAENAGLRERWAGDKARFMTRFRLDDDDHLHILEGAMQYFTKLQERLPQRASFARLLHAGQEALDALVQQVLTGQSSTDYMFIAIDFEGDVVNQRVREFGATKLASWHIGAEADLYQTLQSSNFALGSRGDHTFLFGQSFHLSEEILPRTIQEQLKVALVTGSAKAWPRTPRLILVGHNIQTELRNLRALGMPPEDIPHLEGVVDTSVLAQMVLRRHKGLSLEGLLGQLEIPFHYRHLHCAGNDARYTMQVMLGLLHVQATDGEVAEGAKERLQTLSRMAKQPLRTKAKKKVVQGEMEDHLEGGIFGGF